jgi:Na+/H+ antiporter NhaD/arsenite permease-like protein
LCGHRDVVEWRSQAASARLARPEEAIVGAITVHRTVVGRMSAAVLALGVASFLLGFVEPAFFPLAWISLVGGAFLAVVLWLKHRRSSHPTVSHLAANPEEARPIEPR